MRSDGANIRDPHTLQVVDASPVLSLSVRLPSTVDSRVIRAAILECLRSLYLIIVFNTILFSSLYYYWHYLG